MPPRTCLRASLERNSAGSTRALLRLTDQWRCGPVRRPVFPSAPIFSPRLARTLSDRADPLPACYPHPLHHVDAAEVVVHGDHALPVVEHHRPAVKEEITGL